MMRLALTVGILAIACICLCASVVAWVGVPYIPLSSQPPGRRFVRFGGPVIVVLCGIVAFKLPISSNPADLIRAQIIVLLTPVLCLSALVGLASMIVAVRYRFRPSRRRQE